MRIAINGFGRIGKNFLRATLRDAIAAEAIKVSVINIGPAHPENIGLLFQHDSILGTYSGSVEQANNHLHIDNQRIKLISEADPEKLNWKTYEIDWVVDCSGKFTERHMAEKHLQAGAHAVLISAPAKQEDVAIVMGVNEHAFQPSKHKIVSLGSCTTNAFLPILKILNDAFGLQYGYMTTIHAYTASQGLLDTNGKDPRRSRAAAVNIVPTKTGAAQMVGAILPELAGKIDAQAIRVPVAIVSLIQFAFTTASTPTIESINKVFDTAAANSLRGIVDISAKSLVSSDYIGNPYSVVIDGLSTKTVGPMAHVAGWYDNEWAYSLRMKDFLLFTKQKQ